MLLVLVGDYDILSTGHKINRFALAKLLIVYGECQVDDALNIIVPETCQSPRIKITGVCNLQHPRQIAMELFIYTLHILHQNLLPQHHFVESADEERIQEAAVENRQADDTADEFEIVQMLGVDAGVRVDLKGIIIVGGVFEKAIERVEHFVRKKEEEFSVQC